MNRTKWPNLVVVNCFALILYAAHVGAETEPVVPPGWINDYDYKENVFVYLQRQIENYPQVGKQLYLYVYADDSHCRHVRRLMAHEKLRESSSNAQIIMLEHKRMRELYKKDPENNFQVPSFAPFIVKVAENGGATNHIIFPDVYLYHPIMIKDKKLRRRMMGKTTAGHLEAPLAPFHFFKLMNQFFLEGQG
ncbi:MAG: hypothetical protein AAF431_14900 [Pseudomonadota bacterium]